MEKKKNIKITETFIVKDSINYLLIQKFIKYDGVRNAIRLFVKEKLKDLKSGLIRQFSKLSYLYYVLRV